MATNDRASAANVSAGLALGAIVSTSWGIFWLRRRVHRQRPIKTIPMSCACGKVEYVVDVIDSTNACVGNLVCHCTDCQRFDRVLMERRIDQCRKKDEEGKVDIDGGTKVDLKDVQFADPKTGGTHLIQVYRSHVRLLRGFDKIQACKLTQGTHLSRVYSTCCHCPVFNVFGEPFGTTLPVMTVFGASVNSQEIKDEHPFGRKKDYIFVAEASGPVGVAESDGKVHKKVSAILAFTLIRHMLMGLLLGLGSPTPMGAVTNKTVEVWKEKDEHEKIF